MESAPPSSGAVVVPFCPLGRLCSSSPHLGLPMRVGIERNGAAGVAAHFAGEARGPLPVKLCPVFLGFFGVGFFFFFFCFSFFVPKIF